MRNQEILSIHSLFAACQLIGAIFTAKLAHHFYKSDLSASIAFSLYLISSAYFDFNYTSWLLPFYTVSFFYLIEAASKDSKALMFFSGAIGGFAYSIKAPGGALIVLLLATLFITQKDNLKVFFNLVGFWLLGCIFTLLIYLAVYIQSGSQQHIFDALFPFSLSSQYISVIESPRLIDVAIRIVKNLIKLSPTSSALTLIVLIATITSKNKDAAKTLALPFVFLLTGVAVASIGYRLYEHYFVQVLSGLAVIASHPMVFKNRNKLSNYAVGLLIVVVFLVREIPAIANPNYFLPHSAVDEQGLTVDYKAGAYIKNNTSDLDKVFTWGWDAWPIYYWSDRSAPGRIYKELGSLTDFNTNTIFNASNPIHFKPGAYAEELIAEFNKSPPKYFVYSNWFKQICHCDIEPLNEFTVLDSFLRQNYFKEKTFGGLVLYRLKEGPTI